MKILGFRSDPKAPRYAIVSDCAGGVSLLNASSDSKLPIPASISEDAEDQRVNWLFNEIAQIFEAHPDIAKVVIKSNEYTRVDNKPKRKSAYLDAAVMLCCAQKGVPVEIKIYGSMGTTSSDTKRHAEARVGRTSKYWNTKMADAVNAAWWGVHHP